MIFDAHAHYGGIEGRFFSDRHMIERMDRYGIDRAAMSSTAALFGDARAGNDAVGMMIRKILCCLSS